jgi:hypothetical protein
MRTNWQDKLALLWEEIQLTIINGVLESGTNNSRDFSEQVIKLPDNLQYNLDGSDYAIEVYRSGFYSNNGYIYGFASLDYEQLSEIADYVEGQKKYYQPEWGDEDTLITPNGTELWSYYVYSTKELAKEDFPDRKILEFSGDDIENVYFVK